MKIEYRAWHSGSGCSFAGYLQECYRRVTYWPDGEQKSVQDANGNLTSYDYDNFIRLNKTTFPDSTFERLTLDNNGNIASRKNRAGETLTYQYNALNWIIQKCMPSSGADCPASPAVTDYWTYLLNGQLDTLCEASPCGNTNKIDNNYDTAGRLTQVINHIYGFGADRGMTYTLDKNGNRVELKWSNYDGAYTVGYCFDDLNRMTGAAESPSDHSCNTGTSLATYQYDAMSRRTNLIYGNGASVSSSPSGYSNAGDLLILNHDMSGTANDPHYTFTYTDAHELLTESNSLPAYVWQPSTTGTAAYSTANYLNQYPSFTPQGPIVQPRTLGYDAKGNLTSGNLNSDGTWGYSYDAENRMLTACKPYSTKAAAALAPR
ncbi:MAG: hypothetical protein JOY77_03575 [Alphaproteobacteria bacterium]|nr:hypothetical protein [Alphaproteobacteria bacterium]